MDQGEPGALGQGAHALSLRGACGRAANGADGARCAQVEALELKPVDKASDVPTMVHGTYHRLWPVIGASSASLSSRRPSQTDASSPRPQRTRASRS